MFGAALVRRAATAAGAVAGVGVGGIGSSGVAAGSVGLGARQASRHVVAAPSTAGLRTAAGVMPVLQTATASMCTCVGVGPSRLHQQSIQHTHGAGTDLAVLLAARRHASKKANSKKKKKKSTTDIPEGRSKKRQMLLERRQAAASAKLELERGKESKKSLDFSPQALRCDVLTAIEREEMYYRTKENPIPEFYSGSTLRVTYYESISRGSAKRMVGLCVARRNAKLGTVFTIRNVDDGVAFEAQFDLYSPLIAKIEVLEFARRRRAKLYYLRDRPDKETYVSPAFQPIPPPKDGSVPIKVSDTVKQKTKKPQYQSPTANQA